MFRIGSGSLSVRVIAFSTLWAIAALLLIATVISTLFRQASEQGFESLLSAHLFNLIGAVSASDDGRIEGSPDLGDLRFVIPRSGWYWEVAPVSEELQGTLRSPSLVGTIEAPTLQEVPFDSSFQRRYVAEGLDGELVDVIETEYVLGQGDHVARFRMMGSRSELEEEISAFNRQLYLYLGLFGLGMIAINAAAIWIGLMPLGRVRRALAEIRAGNAQRLDGTFPAEIAPLADETNALIDSNRRIVERARTQVGNLAHSLKTPLAVLMNEGKTLGGDTGKLVVDQASLMRAQVEHYLQRARIAAQADTLVFRTDVEKTVENLVRVMRKLNSELIFEVDRGAERIVFNGEKGDLEEILGNLLENAGKWARTRVRLSILSDASNAARFCLLVEDDGPGIPEEQRSQALRRGTRLDETKPGTGLGLSIVSDLVAEYGGTVALDRSRLGGLKVVTRLPRTRDQMRDNQDKR